MDLKLAHIIHDEKFPDSAYNQFEAVVPGCSDYFLFGQKKDLVHLKRVQPTRLPASACRSKCFSRRLEQYDAVLLHGLNASKLELVARATANVRFVWIGMGFDYYDLIFQGKNDLLKPETLAFVRRNNRCGPRDIARAVKCLIKNIIRGQSLNKARLIQKIRWFAPVLDTEYELVKEQVDSFAPSYIDWNYGSSVPVFERLANTDGCRGNKILVGNSGAPTNNHLDAFKLLHELGSLGEREIVVPFSYGGSDGYRRTVIEAGSNYFGAALELITDFMPLMDYVVLLQSCSTVVMNQRRQQAGGAVGMTMYLGCRLFMEATSPLCEHYRRHGAHINSLDDLIENPQLLNKPLSQTQVDENREILRNLSGRETILNKTRKLIETVTDGRYAETANSSRIAEGV